MLFYNLQSKSTSWFPQWSDGTANGPVLCEVTGACEDPSTPLGFGNVTGAAEAFWGRPCPQRVQKSWARGEPCTNVKRPFGDFL